jgi:hypothetical protein
MQKIKLRPSKPGLKVSNPATNLHLKDEGEFIALTSYWRRRLNCGDVIEVKEEPKKEKKNQPKKFNSNVEKQSEE